MPACLHACPIGVALLAAASAASTSPRLGLGEALTRLAAERNVLIIYAPELVAGKRPRPRPLDLKFEVRPPGFATQP